MPVMFYLWCLNPKCSYPIWLPPSTRPDITCDHKPWPRDGMLKNFVCPICKHVSSRTVEELRCDPSPGAALLRKLRAAKLICIEIPCVIEGCKAHLLIHSIKGATKCKSAAGLSPALWQKAGMPTRRRATTMNARFMTALYAESEVSSTITGANRRLHNQSQERVAPWPDYLCNGDVTTASHQ